MTVSPTRTDEIETFLRQAGWERATRHPLPGDASTRRYVRLKRGDESAMLMDAPGRGEDPPCPVGADAAARRALGWNATSRLAASRVDAFIAIARHLASRGLTSPRILAADPGRGLALLEDLGEALFAVELAAGRQSETELYAEAGALLADLQAAEVPDALNVDETGERWPILEFDETALAANIDLFADWLPRYLGAAGLSDADRAQWEAAREALIPAIRTQRQALVLRDYHAENLLWLPDRTGQARIGLLDFQDAVKGPASWDMSMLLHDARRDVSAAAHEAAVRAYLERTGGSRADFDRDLALSGLANTLRILGIFSRLVTRDGKGRYAQFMPREWGHLARIALTPGLEAHARMIDLVAPDWRRRAA